MGKQSVGLDQARRILAALGQVGAGVDLEQFRLGIEAEQEHTADLTRAGRIALDHLREFPDYYTRLLKMEERARAGMAPNPNLPQSGAKVEQNGRRWYYHTASPANRESISKLGLRPGVSASYGPPAVYLWKDQWIAETYYWIDENEILDVWKVDAAGLPIEKDPEDPDTAFFTTARVGPERLRFVGTFSEGKKVAPDKERDMMEAGVPVRPSRGVAPNPKIVSLGPTPMYAAAGLTPNRAYLDDIVDRLREVPNFTNRIGLKRVTAAELERRAIGAGAYAHAFQLDDGRVLKVTDDRDDGLAAETVRRIGPSPGLATVFEVWKLPGTVIREEYPTSDHGDSIRSLYAIVTEFVEPFDKKYPGVHEPGTPAHVKFESKAVRATIIDIAKDFRHEVDKYETEALDAAMLDRLYSVGESSQSRSSIGEKYMRDVFAGLRKLADRGFVVRDVHLRNMGVTQDGRAVVFDFGHGSQSRSARPISVDMASNPSGGQMRRCSKIFDECFDVVEEMFPDFGTCELHHDERGAEDNGAGSERQFGYCMDGDPIIIAFAAKIEKQPDAYIRGLMRHEFGHAVDFRYGKKALEKEFGVSLPNGVEKRADAIAELVFGDPIEYGNLDIQCIGCGGKVGRPKHLAQ